MRINERNLWGLGILERGMDLGRLWIVYELMGCMFICRPMREYRHEPMDEIKATIASPRKPAGRSTHRRYK